MSGRRGIAVLAALALWLGAAGGTVRADPVPPPASEKPCAERYPADGPAGVDLQLGCIAAEIVSSYTGEPSSGVPPRISSWLVPLGGGLAAVLAVVLVGAAAHRRLDRRLAPVVPAIWWSCPRCRSLNAGHAARCYACGEPWSPEAPTVETATGRFLAPGRDSPGTPGGGAANDRSSG